MEKLKHYNLFGIKIHNSTYEQILGAIASAISSGNQLTICYANANTLNLCTDRPELADNIAVFDLIHPDGIGINMALRFLFKSETDFQRINGSDLYSELIIRAIKYQWRIFIFGDSNATLDKIVSVCPALNLTGSQNGYDYQEDRLIKKINSCNVDILLVGLGTPKQEEWIAENKSKIISKVIIAVGDGIKVFAGTKKRGPRFLQKIGFEWFVRFIYDPKRLWKRYFFGIPLFIFKVVKLKFINSKAGK